MPGRTCAAIRWRYALTLAVVFTVLPHTALAATFYPPVLNPQVIQEFQAPNTPYGAGHRGVDFAAEPYAPIFASANGTVTFAGHVGGLTWVTITHPNGFVTSYGPLTNLTVKAGEQVRTRQPLGVLAAGGHGPGLRDNGLHFSLRINGEYHDPLTLFAPFAPTVSLVGSSLWEAGGAPLRYGDTWRGNRLGGFVVAGSDTARLPHRFYPPNEAHLVLINGLGTTSDTMLIDPTLLGYGPESYTVFSYAKDGGVYSAKDTWAGPDAQLAALRALLEKIAREQPGRPVAIVAHSQGGLIALETVLALGEETLTNLSLPVVSHVVTVASPLHGSDLASAGVFVFDELHLGGVATAAQSRLGLGADTLPLDAPAIRTLDPRAPNRSSFGQRWVRGWQQAAAENPHGPLVLTPRVVSVSGQADLVVTKPRTRIMLNGIPQEVRQQLSERTLPGSHGSVKNTDALHEIVDQALSGEQLTPAAGHLSHAAGSVISTTVDVVRDVFHRALRARGPGSAR